MIVSGSTSQAVSAALAARLDVPLAAVEYREFPDGELLASVPGFDGERAVVVVSTTTSDAHLEVLQLQDAVREAGASEVVTVLPYFGYARQDRAFKPGQPVSARAVARAISSGTDRVVTVNPHEDHVAGYFDVPCTIVDAGGRLATALPDDLMDPLFVSPDEGAIDIASTVRAGYGAGETDFFEKTRDVDTGETSIAPSDTAVVDRDVVVVDDIVATGGTMAESVDIVRAGGANRVFAACVHPLLAGTAHVRLARAGVEAVYATDTIERAVSSVSVAPVLAPEL